MSSHSKSIAPAFGQRPPLTPMDTDYDDCDLTDSAPPIASALPRELPTSDADPQHLESSSFIRRQRTSAFLVSFIFHTAILLLLALWSVTAQLGRTNSLEFSAASPLLDQDSDLPQMLLATGESPPPPSPVQSLEFQDAQASNTSQVSISEMLLPAGEQPTTIATATRTIDQILAATSTGLSASFSATGVDGRQPEQRRQLALARGGTIESELAVERALEWLAAHQLPNGGWSLVHDGGACNGRCGNPGSHERFDPAATGLSLLAFLGAGYTHQSGKHRETVRKGVYFLYQIMEETRQGGSFLYQSDRGMYNHGIAAFALCEAYQLTLDPELKRAAQLAVDFTVSAQNYQGGWGYLPKQPGDLTISGWQVMALKSAHAAELNMPSSTTFQLDTFLDSQQDSGGVFYGYGSPKVKSGTCTAIGHLLRLFRGRPHTDPRVLEGADYLMRVGRSGTDVYFNYYVSLFLFHLGDPLWSDWNPTVRDYLVKTQATGGHEAGSWYFDNLYGKEGGRLYTTAMAAMTLEVYYRFSPLYQQVDEPFEL